MRWIPLSTSSQKKLSFGPQTPNSLAKVTSPTVPSSNRARTVKAYRVFGRISGVRTICGVRVGRIGRTPDGQCLRRQPDLLDAVVQVDAYGPPLNGVPAGVAQHHGFKDEVVRLIGDGSDRHVDLASLLCDADAEALILRRMIGGVENRPEL